MSTTTAGTGLTGLPSGTGLQLGALQTAQPGLNLPKSGTATSVTVAPNSLAGSLKLGQPAGLKLPTQAAQPGLSGLSQAPVAATVAPGLTIKPQAGIAGEEKNSCIW